jgi:hypothetical protein
VKRLLLAGILSLAVLGFTWAQSPRFHVIRDITFDKDGGGPGDKPVVIPKDWKLVSAQTGAKQSYTNLWFQDSTGSVFRLDCYTDSGSFVVGRVVDRIEAEK